MKPLHHLVACLVLGLGSRALAAGVPGQSSQALECPSDDSYSRIDLLDAGAAPAARQQALLVAQRLARHPSCGHERYLLGSLYRFGEELPGNLLGKDVPKARELIEQYGRDGHLQAFADLAEIALAADDYRNAMLWTQVYLYFVTRHGDALTDFDRGGYNADLLLRAHRAWQKADRPRGAESIEELLQGYLKPHKATVLAGLADRRAETAQATDGVEDPTAEQPDIRVKRRPREDVALVTRIKPGYAVFLLEIQPSGRVSRVVPESFGPTAEHAHRLRPFVDGFEFHPFAGEDTQTVRVPVQYGFSGTFAPALKTRKKAAPR